MKITDLLQIDVLSELSGGLVCEDQTSLVDSVKSRLRQLDSDTYNGLVEAFQEQHPKDNVRELVLYTQYLRSCYDKSFPRPKVYQVRTVTGFVSSETPIRPSEDDFYDNLGYLKAMTSTKLILRKLGL